MINTIKKLLKPKYEPLNKVYVLKKSLLDNFNYLSSLRPGLKLIPILKSNAYGHGLREVAKVLNESSAKMVGVDSFPEAQIVYKNFKGKVLILGEMPLRAYDYCLKDRTEFVVYNLETVKYLSRHKPGASIHLFINSGMNREGISDIENFLIAARQDLSLLKVSGCMTHLASAEENSDLNQKQLDKFFKDLDIIFKYQYRPEWIHAGNSAATFSLKDDRLNASRIGLALFGHSPFSEDSPHYEVSKKLKPAMKVVSTIVGKQNLKKGDKVSYNELYEAKREVGLALVPFGYYEGLDRRMSNTAQFLVLSDKPFYAKVAGRVCMNLVCLDCGENNFRIGDRVEIVSPFNSDEVYNSIKNLAKISQTIPYELLVKIQSNIRREVI